MSSQTWFGRRGDFNHQWLSNNYLLRLRCWVADLESGDAEADPDFEESFVHDTLPQWDRRSVEARALIDEAVDVLSPRRLCDQIPLKRMPDEQRHFWAPVWHQLWLGRTQHVRDRATAAIDAVDAAYKELCECLAGCPVPSTPGSARECLPVAKEFATACEELQAAMELLPKSARW
ncbi:hypothetical protein [Aporhodopirellula aestuarii]|uniref:Uncharacterized protein n=1 Tax=Aporhodopirellula aestuarii TaxID=2950107 RepID=A0ABT0UCB1_9BACT|nr:hypothetical protein [Aporhodopirellula aestuarii]MCM2374647.1 hypothetical protein [Aporhodopirellula aestuarii]